MVVTDEDRHLQNTVFTHTRFDISLLPKFGRSATQFCAGLYDSDKMIIHVAYHGIARYEILSGYETHLTEGDAVTVLRVLVCDGYPSSLLVESSGAALRSLCKLL